MPLHCLAEMYKANSMEAKSDLLKFVKLNLRIILS